MFDLVVDRARAELADYRGQSVDAADLTELDEGTTVHGPDGQVLLAYHRLWNTGDEPLERLRRHLDGMRREPGQMMNGLRVSRRAFGRWPRSQPREDWCRNAKLDREHPELADELIGIAAELERRYAALNPVTYAHHALVAERVLPEWRLPGCRCFTGGVINVDSAIGYHMDRGNFKATFSAMPIVNQGTAGGHLVVPELGAYVQAKDGMCVFFDGQSLLHGVTPIRRTQRAGHRYTVVFYSASQLWHCLPPADESERANRRRADRELRRAAGKIDLGHVRPQTYADQPGT